MFLTHFFLVKKIYDMCFDNLIKVYASNHYYINKPCDINPLIPLFKHALKDRYLFLKKMKSQTLKIYILF
jgi:hypothetical protein